MRGKVACFASAKGGSGKTVLTATFATFLAALDYRVLMVDTDAATNGLSLLYLRDIVQAADAGTARPRGLFELTDENAEPTVVPLRPNLDLLPATYAFRNTENTPLEGYAAALRKTVERCRNTYDFIFLDAQAGTDAYAQLSIDASVSDQVIIVSEYDPMSAAGVERLKALFSANLEYFRTWVLLNKMLPDFVKSFSDFLEIARYASPIPWDANVVRAYARRSLALDLEQGNDYTLAVMQTMRALFGGQVSERLDIWLQTRADALREPIREQLREAKQELGELRQRQERDLGLHRRRALAQRIAISLAVATAALSTFYLSQLRDVAVSRVLSFAFTVVTAAVATFGLFFGPAEPDDSVVTPREAKLLSRIDRLRDLDQMNAETVLREHRSTR